MALGAVTRELEYDQSYPLTKSEEQEEEIPDQLPGGGPMLKNTQIRRKDLSEEFPRGGEESILTATGQSLGRASSAGTETEDGEDFHTEARLSGLIPRCCDQKIVQL